MTLAQREVWILTTIDSQRDRSAMSTNTMSFALPEAMRSYVDLRVRIGHSAPSAPRAPSLIAHRH